MEKEHARAHKRAMKEQGKANNTVVAAFDFQK